MFLKRYGYSIILSLVFSAVLAMALPVVAPFVLVALLLIVLLPQKTILIIGLTSLLFQLLPEKLTFFYNYSMLSGVLDPSLPIYLTKLSPVTGLIGIVTLFLLIQFRKIIIFKFKIARPLFWGLTLVLLSFFLLIWFIEHRLFSSWGLAISTWTVIALAKYMWFFAYDLQVKDESEYKSFVSRAAFYSQFWTFRLIAPTIPRGENFWTRFAVTNADELRKLRHSALFLLIWGVFLEFTFDLYAEWTEKLILFENYRLFTIDQMLSMVKHGRSLHPLQVIVSGLSDNLVHLMHIVAWGHIAVAVIWFCGFKVPKNTDSPHLSKDPLDFFARVNFYLKEIVFQLFYFPCFIRLRSLSLPWRVFISIFYAVTIGKFLVNYTKMAPLIIKMGIFNSLKQHLAYLIYCVLLTMLLYPFLMKSLKNNQESVVSLPKKLLISFAIFFGYTAIRMFDTIWMNDPAVNAKLFLLFFGVRI